MPRKPKEESSNIVSNKDIESSSNTPKSKNSRKNSVDNTSVSKVQRKTRSSKKSSTIENKTSKKTDIKKSKTNTSKASKSTKGNEKAQSTSSSKKASSKKKSNSSGLTKTFSGLEYYDLPYRYNETVVKILAQTPTMLFIYWDISDADKASYKNKYGEDFFSNTKPVLVVRNKTMNYTFEVDINDFANSWYLHVNDADCDYSVELGRRPIINNTNIDNYVYVTTSNDMEMPNNHILFDKLGKSVFFKNVKNNFIEEKEIYSLSFIKNLGKVYNIYEFYREIYKEEINKELDSNSIKLNLSSSSSSTFK